MKIDFDLASTPEYTGSVNALLPPGKYPVEIVEERDDANRSGTGRKLILVYGVLEGPCKGQEFSENINYENSSDTSVKIARSRLKSLGVACGKPDYEDTCMLFHIPFVVETIQEEGSDGKLRTVIKRYLPYSGQARQTQVAPTQSPPLNAVPPQQYQQPPQQQAQAYPPPQPPQQQAYAASQYPPQPAQNYAPPQQPQQYQQPSQAAATDAPFWGN